MKSTWGNSGRKSNIIHLKTDPAAVVPKGNQWWKKWDSKIKELLQDTDTLWYFCPYSAWFSQSRGWISSLPQNPEVKGSLGKQRMERKGFIIWQKVLEYHPTKWWTTKTAKTQWDGRRWNFLHDLWWFLWLLQRRQFLPFAQQANLRSGNLQARHKKWQHLQTQCKNCRRVHHLTPPKQWEINQTQQKENFQRREEIGAQIRTQRIQEGNREKGRRKRTSSTFWKEWRKPILKKRKHQCRSLGKHRRRREKLSWVSSERTRKIKGRSNSSSTTTSWRT